MHEGIQMVFNKVSIMSLSGRTEQENTSGYSVYHNLNQQQVKTIQCLNIKCYLARIY